jgi:hypothetical protein
MWQGIEVLDEEQQSQYMQPADFVTGSTRASHAHQAHRCILSWNPPENPRLLPIATAVPLPNQFV